MSSKKMENVLFDLHIAEAEISTNPVLYASKANKDKIFQAVFDKYHVRRSDFDTSLVWYNANIAEYMKINQKLDKRYKTLSDTLAARIKTQQENFNPISGKQNLWKGPHSVLLCSYSRYNDIFRMSVETESIHHLEKVSSCEIGFLVLGLSSASRLRLVYSVQYADKVISGNQIVMMNGFFSCPVFFTEKKPERINCQLFIDSSFGLPLNRSLTLSKIGIYLPLKH